MIAHRRHDHPVGFVDHEDLGILIENHCFLKRLRFGGHLLPI